jgi:signal transduction histidine kinase
VEETSTPALLRALAVSLHVGFAALLVLGVVRVVIGVHSTASTPGSMATVLGLSGALAGVYLAGTAWEYRFSRHRTGKDPRSLAVPWLAVITVLWGALTVFSPDFSWVAFPLFFLYLVLLPRIAAWVCIGALTTVVIAAQYLHAGPGGFTAAMVAGPVLGAVFAVVVGQGYRALYRDAQRHRRTVRRLEAARAELAEQEHQAGRAAERERLSREIHDTLAQGLSSIVLVSRAVQQALDRQDLSLAAERTALIEVTAAENLGEARRFVRDLSSPALDADLPTALRQLCAHTEQRTRAAGQPLTCQLRCEGRIPSLPPRHRTVLLRAAQSSLANVAAHARARTAVLTLAGWDDAVSLDVVDDGLGFTPEALPGPGEDSGFGLAQLQARIEELEGTLSIESEPGQGTAIGIRLPLPGTPPSGGPALPSAAPSVSP